MGLGKSSQLYMYFLNMLNYTINFVLHSINVDVHSNTYYDMDFQIMNSKLSPMFRNQFAICLL